MQPKKLPNGSWQVRYRDLEKRQRARNFEKKKDAEDFIIALKHELRSGTYVDSRLGEATLASFWPTFMALKVGKKPNTIADYESMWKVHLEPKWGNSAVARIKQDSFDAWILSLGLSARRTNKLHLLASMILDVAVSAGNLKSHPLKNVTGQRQKGNLPKFPKKEVGMVHTLDELIRIAKCAGDFEDYILFLGLCGIRWGEFAALQVQDLDLAKGTIYVHQTVSEINGKQVWTDSTKTHEDRTIYLMKFLRDRAGNWVKNKLPTDPLFPSPEGKVLRNSNFTRRIYQPAMVAAGVTRKRIHDLRWTMISISASEGIEQNLVREQVGHSKAYMTSAYTKVFEKDRHIGLEKLNSAVYEVHKKCILTGTEGLDVVENYANTAEINGKFNLETLEMHMRQQDYESAALTG